MLKLFEIIADKEDILPLYSNKTKCAQGIEGLERIKLLPLIISDTKPFRLFIRILGFRYADGCIYYHKNNHSFTFTLYFGRKESAERVCKDIRKVWNIDLSPHPGTNSYCVYVPASIARLAVCAGSPIGKKTLQIFRLPTWVFNLPNELKWEFIDGLFSGDGSVPKLKPCGNCSETLQITLNSEKSIVEEFTKGFMTDIWKLLTSLGIKCSRPKIKWNQPRISKKNVITYSVTVRVLTEKKNMIKFLENVSYRYCINGARNVKKVLKGLKGGDLKEELRKFLNSEGNYSPPKELCVLLEKGLQRELIENAANGIANKMGISWGKYDVLANQLHKEYIKTKNVKLESIKDNYLFWWRDGKKFIPLDFLPILTELCNIELKDITNGITKVKLLRNQNRFAVPFSLKEGCDN